jgi:hypothetical protein
MEAVNLLGFLSRMLVAGEAPGEDLAKGSPRRRRLAARKERARVERRTPKASNRGKE